MKKPRNLLAAQIGEAMDGTIGIWINAMVIGGSVVRITPKDARRIGQRLMEMADYIDALKE